MDPDLLSKPWLFLACCLLMGLAPLHGEESEDGDDKDEGDEESFSEVVAECETVDGLFPLHRNREDGTVYLEISPDQVTSDGEKREFIHFSHTLDGVPELGLFRGQFAKERVLTLRRHHGRIEFVEENVHFHFRPDSALRRAADANISEAVLASAEIEAKNESDGRLLVEADEIFLKEFFRQLKPGKKDDDKERFKLGKLSDDRTRFLETKSFPDNTLFRVQYVFENLHPAKTGDRDVTDSRFVTIKVQHTFMAMPENDYEPRFEDPRVGYFTTPVTDLTSQSSAPYRDLIHRWRLVKEDPDSELSDPVEPITWWIENTTPDELRETIREAALSWNLAFESAGFTNAVEVKIQPDDADWDSDDVRYHVLRWTSSPNPPFGGYGPSFVNPRTGQILGADIMLEFAFVTRRIRQRSIVDLGSPLSGERPPLLHRHERGRFCTFAGCLHANRVSGRAILRARGSLPSASRFGNGPIEIDDLVKQSLTELVLHEIGHTLGLNHNFRASHLHDREQIHDKALTARTGLTASVMDYNPINLAIDPEKQGHYYSLVPGPYDHWAIRYGYDEEEELPDILAESTRPEHAFGNDADDMRRPGRGIDPRIMIFDLTSEPVAHAEEQVQMVKSTLPRLVEDYPVEGETHHELRTAFSTLMRDWHSAAETMSRFIGGVYLDRSVVGQEGASDAPFRPVGAERQRDALDALGKHVLGPDAIDIPSELIAHLQLQRRGFEFFELDDNEDPKIHERILRMQEDVLDHLLHRTTLTRIVDTSLYGNEYGIATFMNDLDELVLTGDPDTGASSYREALQVEYVERLIDISGLEENSEYPAAARGQAIHLLERTLSNPDRLPGLPERHTAHLVRLIENALDAD